MENISLLEKISSAENLRNAWKKLNKLNKESHGLSGESILTFETNLEDKILSISNQLRNNTYKFSSYRPVLIQKSNGKYRPLQIPEISDRLVLKAIAIELEEQFFDLLKKSEGISFAYQKKLGIKDTIERIKQHYNNGNKFVLEADLINFFGEVNKDELINNTILPNLTDSSLNDLIISALNQDVAKVEELISEDKRHYFENINTGIPQGNALSPLLSNIYLSPFDLYLKEKGFNLVRYADDFVILCDTEDTCIKAYEESCSILHSDILKLKIHKLEDADKTKIVDLNKDTVTFLSVTFNGVTFYPSRDNVDKFRAKIREVCNGKQRHSVNILLTKVYNKLDGWISAFYYTDLDRYSKEIDSYINRQLFLSLRNLGWKFSPKSLGKLPNKFRQKNESPQCLSEVQRKNSGVPLCTGLIENKRNNK